MKKIIPFAILIIALLLVKCSNKTATDSKVTVNNKKALQTLNFPDSGEDTLKTSYFADTVIYIPLETTSESLVGSIRSLWMNDSYILVNSRNTPLLLFQRDGKFVRKIGKLGRGPGEYEGFLGFCVIQDTIYIPYSGRRNVLRYTFEGTFCDKIIFKPFPEYLTTTADHKLVSYNAPEGKVYVYNQNFYASDTIVVEHGVTTGRYKWVIGSTIMTHLQKTPSGLLFYDYISDTVWNIDGNNKEPAYILNIKNKLPFDKQIEFSNGNFTEWGNMVKPYIRVHLIPFTSMIIIIQHNWWVGTNDAFYLNNLKTKEIKRYNTNYIYDDIVSYQKLMFTFSAYSKDYLVTTVLGPERDKHKLKGDPSPLWLDLVKSVKETDNPILSLVKLKKNLQ